jgi:RNA polymerase sigma-70 factor (ECF subfamily)
MVQEACRIAAEARESAVHHRGPSPLDLPALYTQHVDLVWRNLRRFGVPDASLDDAVQDVFLVVHRRAEEFLGQSNVKTWIVGIVLRVAHDYRRSQARHSARVALCAEQSQHALPGNCPAEQVELREAAALVRQILERFDEQERNVFVLVELEEMSVREVAESTGLSLSTCQRRLTAARKAFDVALRRVSEPARKRANS